MTVAKDEKLRCSFCGKTEEKVYALITAPDGACICEQCVMAAARAIMGHFEVGLQMDSLGAPVWGYVNSKGKAAKSRPKTGRPLDKASSTLSPKEIYAGLSEYVIGQNDAKIALSVAAYSHYKRLQAMAFGADNGVIIEKSNILMLGPTGFEQDPSREGSCSNPRRALCHR